MNGIRIYDPVTEDSNIMVQSVFMPTKKSKGLTFWQHRLQKQILKQRFGND